MPSLARERGLGAAAGVLATAMMSAVMLVLRAVRFTPQLAPDRIAEGGIKPSSIGPLRSRRRTLVASVAHVGFGATPGALFGIATSPVSGEPLGGVIVAGDRVRQLVWLVSYQGWVPALGIRSPASRDDPARVGMLAASISWLRRGGWTAAHPA